MAWHFKPPDAEMLPAPSAAPRRVGSCAIIPDGGAADGVRNYDHDNYYHDAPAASSRP